MKATRWFLGDVAGIIAASLLAALVLLAVSAVVFRYVVGAPLAWAEEIQQLMVLWIIMIGLIYGKRKNALLRVDALYNLMSARLRRMVSIIQEAVHIALFCLMILYGYRLAQQVGTRGTSMLDIPLYWLYVSLPVGAAGALIISVLQLYGRIKGEEAD